MTGTAAVRYSSNALSGDAVMEGCLEADNILRECSGWRRPGGEDPPLSRRAPRFSASQPVREVEGARNACRRGRGARAQNVHE